ncbi:Hypothetical_protein [Hexamita inflata]|uniref:Hypothetical_protein n=1 Tax=Hexamita inflata TaxID=28002 RepID=A0AA86PQ58_9EUKA|nr:Hypothetical protein HINF_LOCUS29018 [Hexamita inflata]
MKPMQTMKPCKIRSLRFHILISVFVQGIEQFQFKQFSESKPGIRLYTEPCFTFNECSSLLITFPSQQYYILHIFDIIFASIIMNFVDWVRVTMMIYLGQDTVHHVIMAHCSDSGVSAASDFVSFSFYTTNTCFPSRLFV